MPKPMPNLRCSFCGKRKDQVARLVAGPGVFICDECVALCNEILQDKPPATTPVGDQKGDWVKTTHARGWWRRLFRIQEMQPS